MSRLIVVMDDSLTIRKMLSVSLSRAGYDVRDSPGGVEALCWLAAPDEIIPVLVLVDQGLPKLDGYEVMRRLKARPGLEQRDHLAQVSYLVLEINDISLSLSHRVASTSSTSAFSVAPF